MTVSPINGETLDGRGKTMTQIYDRMIEWRERHLSEKHLVLLLSFFVGAFSATAAALLKSFIHLIQRFVETQLIAGGHTWSPKTASVL